MKRARNSQRKGEGGLAIWIILLAMLAGAVWFLYSSRAEGKRKARQLLSKWCKPLR